MKKDVVMRYRGMDANGYHMYWSYDVRDDSTILLTDTEYYQAGEPGEIKLRITV